MLSLSYSLIYWASSLAQPSKDKQENSYQYSLKRSVIAEEWSLLKGCYPLPRAWAQYGHWAASCWSSSHALCTKNLCCSSDIVLQRCGWLVCAGTSESCVLPPAMAIGGMRRHREAVRTLGGCWVNQHYHWRVRAQHLLLFTELSNTCDELLNVRGPNSNCQMLLGVQWLSCPIHHWQS